MDPQRQILSRLFVLFLGLGILPVLVVLQMLRINWVEGDRVDEVIEGVARSEQVLPAMRGTILDRAGRVLAVNTARYEIALDPTASGFSKQQQAFFDQLSSLTGRSARAYRRLLQERSSPQYVLLERSVSEAQREAIEQWDIPGLIPTPRFARRFNYGTLASHLLGHVDVDLTGIAGVEMQYDEFLRGVDGHRVVKRDRLRQIHALVGGSVVEPRHGQHVVLTIDITRQAALEEELARAHEETGANWVTGIAMDPYSGAVLAMANVPTYNPNRAAAFSESARRNRAVTDQFEPGSTFKLVTAVAAIEQGVVRPDEVIDTGNGYARVGRRTVSDMHAYGPITFAEVIQKSSNIGAAITASRLKPSVFYRYARDLGFGATTWIDLPGEETGSLMKPSEWSGTTQVTMSFGYEIAATPLQLLVAYAALANGGVLVQPHVVAERRDVVGQTVWTARPDSIRRAFSRETARTLLPLFEGVVSEEGTAKLARVPGLPIAGKTGTARKVIDGSYAVRHRATFVGFFPADRPEVVLIVVVDEPKRAGYGGGAVAAPVFQRVAERWIGSFPRVVARMAPVDSLPVSGARPVPDVVRLPSALAAGRLAAAGFEVDGPPSDADPGVAFALVVAQEPSAGSSADPQAPVRLVAEALADSSDARPVMPDVTGLSSRRAVAWLAARGVSAQVRGSGQVVDQSPAAGQPVTEKATLTCK